jgi:hypothetical protein
MNYYVRTTSVPVQKIYSEIPETISVVLGLTHVSYLWPLEHDSYGVELIRNIIYSNIQGVFL